MPSDGCNYRSKQLFGDENFNFITIMFVMLDCIRPIFEVLYNVRFMKMLQRKGLDEEDILNSSDWTRLLLHGKTVMITTLKEISCFLNGVRAWPFIAANSLNVSIADNHQYHPLKIKKFAGSILKAPRQNLLSIR